MNDSLKDLMKGSTGKPGADGKKGADALKGIL